MAGAFFRAQLWLTISFLGNVIADMRILTLLTDAFGGYGGIAVYNQDLLRALCSHPNRPEVFALPRLMPRQPEPLPAGLTYITSGLGGKLRYVLALIRLLICAPRFDLILCCHINLLSLAFMARVVTHSPLVLVIYGIDAWKPGSRLNRILLRTVSAYVSISATTEARFLEWAKPLRAGRFILPNAIHLDRYSPGPKDLELATQYGVSDAIVLMTFGRLVGAARHKGFDEVLEVLPTLAVHLPNIIYVIAGDGPDRPRLLDKARALGVEKRVIFTGFVPEEKKVDLYRLADVYVMPSRGEGFGFVLLEAMATGIPTIASCVDGGREALRNGMLGDLVNPDHPFEIEQAILRALKLPKRQPEGLDYFAFERFQARAHRMLDKWIASI